MSSSFRFVKSAVLPQDYPPSKKPEVAITGRSNAGKSSLLNSMSGQKIAKVSSTPGKTRLLNFFDVGSKYTLVDMPGYGFASRSGAEIRQWHQMIEKYLMNRETLKGLLLVMDSRREWTDDEELLKDLCRNRMIPIAVILTKVDKLNRKEFEQCKKRITKQSGVENIFFVSNLKDTGTDDLEKFIYQTWIKSV